MINTRYSKEKSYFIVLTEEAYYDWILKSPQTGKTQQMYHGQLGNKNTDVLTREAEGTPISSTTSRTMLSNIS